MEVGPALTLAVPCYGTARVLPRLLDSILAQEGAPSFKLIIVNDGDPDGRAIRAICKAYRKLFAQCGIFLELLEHSKNLGLIEARRTAVLAARGEYVFFADSDDSLPPQALSVLYKAACAYKADIVHGTAEVVGMPPVVQPALGGRRAEDYCFNNSPPDHFDAEHSAEIAESPKHADPAGVTPEKIEEFTKKMRIVHRGTLEGAAIVRNFLLDNGHNGFLWGKLFRTALIRAAYDEIPHMYCVMAEDFLVYFFAALKAGSYFGIEDAVYRYHADAGISSYAPISDLARWEQVCSAASVFTVLFSYMEERKVRDDPPLDAELQAALRAAGRAFYANNIRQLESRVAPELKAAAYALLEEYWGW